MNDVDREPREDLAVEPATAEDVSVIKAMIDAAYSKYIERIGKPPAAMTVDHGELVRAGGVHVLRLGERVVGSIHLARQGGSLLVDDLVVDPSLQGRGYGRILMEFAEGRARAQGLPALTLFTNEKMHENIALYRRIGFEEAGRRNEDGFARVYFRKSLV